MSSDVGHQSLSMDPLVQSGSSSTDESTESETLTDPFVTEPHQIVVDFSDDAEMDVDHLVLKRSRSINLQVLDRLPPPGLRVRAAASSSSSSPTNQEQGKQEVDAESWSQDQSPLVNIPNLGEFSYTDLVCATENFDEGRLLGEGDDGSVYKGYITVANALSENTPVAVKRLSMPTINFRLHLLMDDFSSDYLNSLSRLQHPHLVKMIGYCMEKDALFLVNEYMSGHSVEDQLIKHRRRTDGCQQHHPFSWNLRLKVALEAAKGLVFLHSQNVIHGDLIPGNILLDEDFNAKLADFGLVKDGLYDKKTSFRYLMNVGFMPEEFWETGYLTPRSDMYCFGMVLLVMLSGLRSSEELDGIPLIDYAENFVFWVSDKKLVWKLADNMGCPYDRKGAYWLAYLIFVCFHPGRKYRKVTMTDIVNSLEFIIENHRI